MSTTHRMESNEDQDALILFHSYPCAYYVQSPSTVSHANSTAADIRNSNDNQSAFLSPTRSETNFNINKNPDVSTFTLSRYSSSRGSNNSFLNEKKILAGTENGVNRLIIVDGIGGDIDEDGEDEEDEEEEKKRSGWWWRYCSFRRSNSCAWVSLQISWRLTVSLAVALLVFYIATKPPPPKMSIKMAGVREFGLAEGVDASGVTTKILTCNCSMNVLIENKSKLFGLHIHPPIMEMSFGRLPFALSRAPKLYAETYGSTLFKLYVGTKNKPMYGAGRSMQDMLESGEGLPLVIRVSLTSDFRVVWNLIKPKFHHEAECLLVLHGTHDKQHRTQTYNSTCTMTTTS